MDVLVERCAGLDVHRDSVMATVRLPGKRRRQREQHKRAFGTTIAQLQELEEWLQGFGIKLTSVASAAYSVSARAMLEALLAGTTDPNELAELARGSLRGKSPQLREALANRFELTHHGVLVSGLLA